MFACLWLIFFFTSALCGAEIQIPDKILICGIGRKIEKAVPNLIRSATGLGSRFADYRVILYENNSNDRTPELLRAWAKENPKVIFRSEKLSSKKLKRAMAMGVVNRTEQIARARNIVLDIAMKKEFDDFKYVVWVDLDFLEPWDVEGVMETIRHPKEEWDAVFAYGEYDLFALRSAEWPIGFELLGNFYLDHLDKIRKEFVLDREGPWKKVYSAFGGVAIYKREALKGCRYSGVVTEELERSVAKWLEKSREKGTAVFLKEYDEFLAETKPIDLPLRDRDKLPDRIGVRMPRGKVVWFSCTKNMTLPWVCEHIPLHVSMIAKGRDRLYINPKLRGGP